MIQNRRQAAANARRAAANRKNSGRRPTTAGQTTAGMRSATGQGTTFRPPAGQFISATPLTVRQKAAIAVSTLTPFL